MVWATEEDKGGLKGKLSLPGWRAAQARPWLRSGLERERLRPRPSCCLFSSGLLPKANRAGWEKEGDV